MRYATARKACLALPGVTEAPHHEAGSFRVGGRIFVTVPPEQTHLHVFVPEPLRDAAVALHPAFVESLRWGGKVVGIRLALAAAPRAVVKQLVQAAWAAKAPAPRRATGATSD